MSDQIRSSDGNGAGFAARIPAFTALFSLTVIWVVLALLAAPAWGDESKKGHQDKMQGGMKMGSCERKIMVMAEAEMQLGGAHFKGPMPKMVAMPAMKGMQMGSGKGKAMKMGDGKAMQGMKMSGDAKGKKGMKGMGGAHADHDAKGGGVLFMAPNELHHVEGSYAPECGFQVVIYNAFTKPIGVGRLSSFFRIVLLEEKPTAEDFDPHPRGGSAGLPSTHGRK